MMLWHKLCLNRILALVSFTLRLLLNTIFIFSFLTAWAQDVVVKDRYDEFFAPRYAGHLAFRNVLLSDDYVMGVEGGVISPSRAFTFFGSFDLRPYRKKILNYQGGNLFYQNAEQRFFLGAGVEYHKYVRDKKYGGFVQLNGNYTWGFYGGMEQKPPKGWVLVPRVGAFWKLTRHIYLKGGYAYVDTKNDRVEKHRLYLSVSGILVK